MNGLLIDEQDRHLLIGHRWRYDGRYVVRTAKERPRTRYLHREIMGNPVGMEVDHINHNRLDNRRANLRVTTKIVNQQNRRGATSLSQTGVRGVTRNGRKYRAEIYVNKARVTVGTFTSLDAARDAVIAARALHFSIPGGA